MTFSDIIHAKTVPLWLTTVSVVIFIAGAGLTGYSLYKRQQVEVPRIMDSVADERYRAMKNAVIRGEKTYQFKTEKAPIPISP